jgi:phenylalanyl-tRNA synthetase beta chain
VHPNLKAGFSDLAVFELNKVHNKIHGLDEAEGVPGELNMLALVVAHKKPQSGAAFYEAKTYLDYVAAQLGLEFTYQPIESELGYPVTAPFEYRRSALITDIASGEFIGMVGEYKKSVAKNFKLPDATAGFEIGPEALLKALAQQPSRYRPLSKYPSIERDICFQVDVGVVYQQIKAAADEALAGSTLEVALQPLDFYRPEGENTKNITVRLKLTSHERTLTSDEAAQVVADLSEKVLAATGGTVI